MIFIVGGNGFVGSAFTRLCEANRTDYAVITRQNYHEFMSERCDILIDSDGNSAKTLASNDPVQDFDANVRSVRARLVDFKYSSYVYVSSCDVYPDCSLPATTVEDETIDITEQSPYGFHKYLAEQCVRYVAPKWLIVRFGGFVGPGLRKNAVYDILKDGPLWLDPDSELQFMHTERAAGIVLELIKRNMYNEIFNICGRGLIKLQDIIDTIQVKPKIQPHSPLVRYDVNIEKISKLFDIPETRRTVLEFVELESKRGIKRKP
jgi:nucleoside-diphosphate-sugar epimerase